MPAEETRSVCSCSRVLNRNGKWLGSYNLLSGSNLRPVGLMRPATLHYGARSHVCKLSIYYKNYTNLGC